MGLIDIVVAMFFSYYPGLNSGGCLRVYEALSWLVIFGIAASELIMVLRTYALFQFNFKLLKTTMFLFAFGAAMIVIPVIVEDSSTHNDYQYTALKTPNIPNCVSFLFKEKGWITLMLLAGFELIIVMLTTWKAIIQRRNTTTTTSLFYVFYRDGVIYFICSFATSVANIFFFSLTDINVVMLQRVLHSNLSARIILHLREVSSGPNVCDVTNISSMRCEVERRRSIGCTGTVTTDQTRTELSSFA